MTTNATEIKTTLKYLRIPARKVRFVAELIKGLPVDEAEAKLMMNPRRPKESLIKLLRSAVANAKNNNKADVGKLFVKNIRVDQGPMFTRWTTRSRGGMSEIQKKTSHVTLILGVSEKPVGGKFNIARPKKEEKTEKPKKEEREKETNPKSDVVKEMKETNEMKPVKEPGTFKKVFRRKAI